MNSITPIAVHPIRAIFNDSTVRFAEVNSEVLVSAFDVMTQLGYADPTDTWSKMKPKVEALFGTIAVLAIVASNGKTYQMAYLNQEQLIAVFLKSNKEAAVPFFKWAVSTLKDKLNEMAQQAQQAEIDAAVEKAIAPVKNEAYYHQKILDLANFSSLKFRSEAIFDNTIVTDDNVRHRRTDLIRVTTRSIIVYELKAHQITEEDISKTLATKGYLTLIAKQFPNKPINFKFLSPFGISNNGVRHLELMAAQDKYRDFNLDGVSFRAKVSYEPVQSLSSDIKANIIKHTPSNHAWYVEKYIAPDFADILNYPNMQPKLKVIPFPIRKIDQVA
ncbi:MAG: hypothetical protein HY785_22210 [Oscillatoriophycideae cyanobacterium NC_groundwater_1537_Pr4_S-0.65um_50_18]|nr:hypothetical protein [Oscillatoriophycideae cyanobacterium NC_groundwater_1537_Pr4_S-0.65um_50_18]